MAAHRFTREQLLEAPVGFTLPMSVRFQDVDAFGIVFYPQVQAYCHDAYVQFLSQHQCPLHKALTDKSWAAPLVHAEADYLKPLRFGDAILVQLVAAVQQGSVVTLGFRINRDSGEPVAVAQTAHVFVDPTTFARVAPPARMLAALATLGSTPKP